MPNFLSPPFFFRIFTVRTGGELDLRPTVPGERATDREAHIHLQRRWDPTFSEHSHGFRPKRSAHQAIAKAQQYIAAGHRWVVDLDLEKFPKVLVVNPAVMRGRWSNLPQEICRMSRSRD
jgi:hypothetical protein